MSLFYVQTATVFLLQRTNQTPALERDFFLFHHMLAERGRQHLSSPAFAASWLIQKNDIDLTFSE